jgi:UDP-2,4-diacetamido-2,4,6-trideoxy-beta-L-altropyranose hydrolase
MPTTSPQVIILTEANSKIGFGHCVRCQALADAFSTLKIKTKLILNKYPKKLPTVELIIIDSYRLSSTEYQHYKQFCRILAVIDDTQRLAYPADIIINPALGAEHLTYNQKYILLAGVRYTLLKKEFWKVRSYHKKIRNNNKHLLITLGASTPLTVSKKISSALTQQHPLLHITIAHGKHSSEDMIDLMKNTDVAISAGGQTLYELACLGVPTIALQTADNQKFNLQQWQQVGFIDTIILPNKESFLNDIQTQFVGLTLENRLKKSSLGKEHIDGRGALRAAQELIAYIKKHD